MDNPGTDSTNAPLNIDQAASLFNDALLPPKEDKPQESDEDKALIAAIAEPEASQEPAADEATEGDTLVTVKIDGQDRQVPLSEVLKGYQLAKASTERFEEASHTKREAEALALKAREEQAATVQERQTYGQNLARMAAQLEGALQEQGKINWQELLDTNPTEYLRQQLLANQRQGQLQQNYAEQQRVSAIEQADRLTQVQTHLAQQHEKLQKMLPDWKDESKAKTEKAALREYLGKQGYETQLVDNLADARTVILARKAMLYDALIEKAAVATKKVGTLPPKVERPGTGQVQQLDKRAAAYQRLSKSGKVEDAASLFSSLL